MWETLQIISEPVSLADAKKHLRLNPGTDEDDYVNMLISAARQFAENYIGRSIAVQQILCTEVDAKAVWLPRPPVTEVQSVLIDGEPVEYDYDSINGLVVLEEKAERVDITYKAGYATCPAGLKLAILLLIANWYENREAVVTGSIASVTPPLGAVTLLNQHKDWWF